MIKVFLVEDEVVIRNGIKNSIDWEKEGYQFAGEASDGELALTMILKEKPDIVITDIHIFGMDRDFCKRITAPECTIIYLSKMTSHTDTGNTFTVLKCIASYFEKIIIERKCFQ